MHRLVSRVCVVGSGPAAFYTAQHVIKLHPTVRVDILEKLPVPYGLVRYGVAPDHPEVKNVENTFAKVANHNRCRFLGNVHVGQHVSVQTLRSLYNAVIFAYGAEKDRKLGIEGEHHRDVISALDFVGWYNGFPDQINFQPNLHGSTAVILGHGNVALDVARILMSSPEALAHTDITDYALERLRNSTLKRLYLVGRRGPLQVSFTVKELREMTKLSGCRPVLNPADFQLVRERLPEIARPRKRLMELMCKTAFSPDTSRNDVEKEWHLRFFNTPRRIVINSEGNLEGVEFEVNQLDKSGKAVGTGDLVFIPCSLVIRSIGYHSVSLDSEIPFDYVKGIIPNDQGRVGKGFYCSGWVKTGPVGVIASTMTNAMETAKALVEDLEGGLLEKRESDQDLVDVLEGRVVSFQDWEKIDRAEIDEGRRTGKLREKIVSVEKMMDIALNTDL